MPWLCFKSWTHHLAFMLTSISVKCLVTAPLTFSQVALKSPTIPILKSWVDEFFHQFINHNSLKPKTSILVVGLVDSQVALTHSVYVVVSASLCILHVPHLHHYLVHLARTTPPSLSRPSCTYHTSIIISSILHVPHPHHYLVHLARTTPPSLSRPSCTYHTPIIISSILHVPHPHHYLVHLARTTPPSLSRPSCTYHTPIIISSILHVPHLHHYLVHLARTTPPSLSRPSCTYHTPIIISSILHVPHPHHYLVHLARTTPPSLSCRALQLYDQDVCRCISSTAVLSILGLRSLLTVPTCT